MSLVVHSQPIAIDSTILPELSRLVRSSLCSILIHLSRNRQAYFIGFTRQHIPGCPIMNGPQQHLAILFLNGAWLSNTWSLLTEGRCLFSIGARGQRDQPAIAQPQDSTAHLYENDYQARLLQLTRVLQQ